MIKVARKPKIKKMPKSFDQAKYGDEPIIIGAGTETQFIEAFNWYNYFYDSAQAKKWLLEYLKKTNRSKDLIENIRSAPDWRTVTTAGWVARMLMNGTTFNAAYMERFEDRIKTNAQFAVKVDETKEEKTVVSIQDRIKKNTNNLLAEAESFVVDARGSMYEFLQTRQVNPAAAKKLLDYYQPICNELMSDDEQVKEAYGKKLKAEREFMQSVLDDLNRYVGNKKVVKVRAPRTKKVKTAIDLIKNLKYQKEFPELKIVSVNPTEIIGATQLWTYNTKYKKLTQYVVTPESSSNGLQVKGTTLLGWDEKLSGSKSLRKPELSIADLLKSGKVALRGFLDTLKTTHSTPNGRINEDTILLRVMK